MKINTIILMLIALVILPSCQKTKISNDICDCADNPTQSINLGIGAHMLIPNIFTPNGDGYNDVFTIYYMNVTSFSMKIYKTNILKSKVFETDDVSKGWDGNNSNGKAEKDGKYKYEITATGHNVTKTITGYVCRYSKKIDLKDNSCLDNLSSMDANDPLLYH